MNASSIFSIAMNLAPPEPLADATACRVYRALVIELASALGGDVPFPWRQRIASLANGIALRREMLATLAVANRQDHRHRLSDHLAIVDERMLPITRDVFAMFTACGAPSATAH